MDLENRIKNLAGIIFQGRNCLHLYWEISQKADKINSANFGRFFSVVQDAALKCCALDLCKIYETPTPRYPLNSIPQICEFLKTIELKQDIKDFSEDVKKLNIELIFSEENKSQAGNKFITTITEHLRCIGESEMIIPGLTWMREGLDKAKTLRDKYVAHSEIASADVSGPSVDIMDRLFSWAEMFIEVVLDNFNHTTVSWNIKGDSASYRMATLRVMKELDIIEDY